MVTPQIITPNRKTVEFDAKDAEYLADNFSIAYLKEQAELAEICRDYLYDRCFDRATLRKMIFNREYGNICREAILLARARQPKPTVSNHKFIDVEALKAKLDIVTVAERYTQLRKAGAHFVGLCPIHSEKTGSFFVYPQKQSWHCFGACSTGGDAISLVMKAEHLDFKGAIAILGGNS